MHACIQTDRQTYRQTYIQTDRRTYVRTYIHTCIHVYMYICIYVMGFQHAIFQDNLMDPTSGEESLATLAESPSILFRPRLDVLTEF